MGTPTGVSHRRLLTILLLLALGAVLGCEVFFLSAAVAQADRAAREYRNLFLLAMGVLGLAGWICIPRHLAQGALNRALEWLALLVPGYAAFQLLPLPLSVLRVLSPARADLIDALAPLSLRPSFAPLSVAPSLTLIHLLLFAAYAAVFLLIREIGLSNPDRVWLPVLPILAIAIWQAGWGVSQYLAGGDKPFAHGTYPVRNHFAGFLEMSLPFALAYGAAELGKGDRESQLPMSTAVRAGAGFTAAALIIVGILSSLSRMGSIACVGSLLVMLALGVKLPGNKKWPLLMPLCLAVVLAFALLAPVQLVLRFSQVTSEDRPGVWQDTLHLIAAYPVFGCGAGGYESAFEKFKTSGFEFVQDYAHNDYLQFLAELGLLGFLIAGAFLILIAVKAVQSSLRHPDPDSRWLGLACSGALAAILIHSLADFNLYVPANATLLAWISGLAASIPAKQDVCQLRRRRET